MVRRLSELPSPRRGGAVGGHRVVSAPRPPAPLILVEGGSLTRAQLRHALTSRGFAVECRSEGTAVREANSKSAFASAVVEPWMADGDGLGRLKELRRESPGMQIVIVTAHDSFAAAILALRAGPTTTCRNPSTSVRWSIPCSIVSVHRRGSGYPACGGTDKMGHINRVFAQCGHDVRRRRASCTCNAAPCEPSSPGERRRRA